MLTTPRRHRFVGSSSSFGALRYTRGVIRSPEDNNTFLIALTISCYSSFSEAYVACRVCSCVSPCFLSQSLFPHHTHLVATSISPLLHTFISPCSFHILGCHILPMSPSSLSITEVFTFVTSSLPSIPYHHHPHHHYHHSTISLGDTFTFGFGKYAHTFSAFLCIVCCPALLSSSQLVHKQAVSAERDGRSRRPQLPVRTPESLKLRRLRGLDGRPEAARLPLARLGKPAASAQYPRVGFK